ncbi:MAG: R3H domain-containing nucleic acid-binding protein [Myxococcota bacterium]
MPDLKEFIAEDRAAALTLAEQHFGVGPDQLEVVDVAGEVYGLGGRVMILARIPGSGPAPEPDGRRGRSDRGARSERSDRGRRRERNDRGGRSDRGGRGRRDGDSRRPRDSRAAEPERPQSEPAGPDRDPEVPAAAAAGPLATGGLGEVGAFVAGLLERMGAGEGVQVQEQRSDRELRISACGAGVDALMARDPRIIGSLTHLADRAAVRYVDRGVRVKIELAGSEAGIDESDLLPDEQGLLEEARRLAHEVVESGEPRETIELSSRERWLVHNGLREIDGVKSESMGGGSEKRVRILPEESSR